MYSLYDHPVYSVVWCNGIVSPHRENFLSNINYYGDDAWRNFEFKRSRLTFMHEVPSANVGRGCGSFSRTGHIPGPSIKVDTNGVRKYSSNLA
jgi:hypothetical protein